MKTTLDDYALEILGDDDGEKLWRAIIRRLTNAQLQPSPEHSFIKFTTALRQFAFTGNVADAAQLQKALDNLISDDFRHHHPE